MRLRGDDGYFANEVTIEDVTFRYRELEPDEQERVQAVAAPSMEKRRKQAALARKFDTDGDLSDEEFTQMNQLGQEALQLEREGHDLAVGMGLVSWEGPGLEGVECTPENARRLPPHVKAALTRAIGKETSLTFDESDFSSGQPTQ